MTVADELLFDALPDEIKRIVHVKIRDALQDAYDRGYDDGKEEASLDGAEQYDEGFQDGLALAREKYGEQLCKHCGSDPVTCMGLCQSTQSTGGPFNGSVPSVS